MINFKIRNDDVAYDTNLSQLEAFCNICDKYGVGIIQCITPRGSVQFIDSKMTNEEIVKNAGSEIFTDNKAVYDYLLSRSDEISLHGEYHTHYPTADELYRAKYSLIEWGFNPTYSTYPFNELTFDYDIFGLKTLPKSQRLEDYHKEGLPTDEIVYLHSWRYGKWYPVEALERMLERIANARG